MMSSSTFPRVLSTQYTCVILKVQSIVLLFITCVYLYAENDYTSIKSIFLSRKTASLYLFPAVVLESELWVENSSESLV